MMKVSIVILNWNRPDLTLECLESVGKLNAEGFELEVVVVDNGSTDNSSEKLGKVNLSNARYHFVKNKDNLGFAAGNNVGIKYALDHGAGYILILNNDTLIDSNFVVEVLKTAKKDSKVGAVSPKIYFNKGFEFHKSRYEKNDLGKVVWAAGGVIDWNNVYGSNIGVDEVDRGQFDDEMSIEYVSGTAAFYTREAIEKVGMFDEKFFMYYEDTDLSIRIKRSGYKIRYCPRAVVWHKVAQSSGIGSGLNDYFTTRNRMLFGLKYAGLRTKFALVRESLKLLFFGREWQRVGIRDYYMGKFGRGSWK